MINWGSQISLDATLPALTAFLWWVCLGAGCLAGLAIAVFAVEVRRALHQTADLLPQSEFMGFVASAPAPPPDRIWESHESTRDPLHDSLDAVGRDAAVA